MSADEDQLRDAEIWIHSVSVNEDPARGAYEDPGRFTVDVKMSARGPGLNLAMLGAQFEIATQMYPLLRRFVDGCEDPYGGHCLERILPEQPECGTCDGCVGVLLVARVEAAASKYRERVPPAGDAG